MSDPKANDIEDIWFRLKGAYMAYLQSVHNHELDEIQETRMNAFLVTLREFLVEDIDRVKLLKLKLRGEDTKIAVMMLEYLNARELENLFSELIFLVASAHWAVQRVRTAILSLPREWVLSRIEEVAEPLLVTGTYDEYRRLLELYVLLDPALTRKLAERAAKRSDPDIREAGEDFLV